MVEEGRRGCVDGSVKGGKGVDRRKRREGVTRRDQKDRMNRRRFAVYIYEVSFLPASKVVDHAWGCETADRRVGFACEITLVDR